MVGRREAFLRQSQTHSGFTQFAESPDEDCNHRLNAYCIHSYSTRELTVGVSVMQ